MWVKKIVDFVSGSLPARRRRRRHTPFTPAYRGGKSAVPPLALADAQRLPGGGGGGISDDESEAGSTVSEALARLPWWRRHLGTDILVSAWLWMLGCAMYLVWACIAFFEPVTSYHSLGIRWCELVSSVLFVWGCFYLLKASYPQQLLALAHELSKPPREMGCLEMCVYSNSMLLSTQLFNAGTLPTLVRAAAPPPPPRAPRPAPLSVVARRQHRCSRSSRSSPRGRDGDALRHGLRRLPLIIFWCAHTRTRTRRLPPPPCRASSPTLPATTRCGRDGSTFGRTTPRSAYVFEL